MLSNKILFIVTFLLAAFALRNQEHKKNYFINNDSLEILKGHVKQVITAPIDDEYSTNPGQDFDTVNFNKQGDVTKIIRGFHGSIFRDYYTTKYSADGKKLKTTGYIKPNDAISFLGNSPSSLMPKPTDTSWKDILTYKYDEHGYIIQYVLKGNKSYTDSTTYEYDSNGNVIEVDYYANPTLLMDVTKYNYDENNNLVEANKFHWKRLMTKSVFKYTSFDSNNNWIDEIVHFEGYLGFKDVRNFKIHRTISYY